MSLKLNSLYMDNGIIMPDMLLSSVFHEQDHPVGAEAGRETRRTGRLGFRRWPALKKEVWLGGASGGRSRAQPPSPDRHTTSRAPLSRQALGEQKDEIHLLIQRFP